MIHGSVQPRDLVLFPFVALLAAFAAFGWLEWRALSENSWVFEYPLDDVYIHLAMSEQIANGGYGVNAGEYASAASSPLYPLLLLPFAGEETQRWLPLAWNILGLIAAAILWGRTLAEGGFATASLRPVGLVAAAGGPVFLNMFGLTYIGMEHTLHLAATLAIVLGLVRLLQQGELGWLLFVGILFSPMLRLEGLALALLAGLIIWWKCGAKAGGLALILGLVPAIAFSAYLTSLGLSPLPSSVEAKLVSAADADLGLIQRAIGTFQINIHKRGGLFLLAEVIAILALFVMTNSADRNRRVLAGALILAGFGHLFLGQIGWLDRYEGYLIGGLAAGLLVLAAPLGRIVSLVAMALLGGFGTWAYSTAWTEYYPVNPRAIYLQPAQSARFAKDFARVPVAVNDLGLVSWRNPDYVLDLWGLASDEARDMRIHHPVPGWAAPLALRHDVQVAMIYDDWLEEAVGADWVLLGNLRMIDPKGYLGDDNVAYYATDPAFVSDLLAKLDAWAATLPKDAYFDFAPGLR